MTDRIDLGPHVLCSEYAPLTLGVTPMPLKVNAVLRGRLAVEDGDGQRGSITKENKMSQSEQVLKVLNESFAELSRAEISARTGMDRERVRKVLHLLIKEGKVSRRIDDNGIEWLGGPLDEETKPVIKEEPPCVEEQSVEPSLPTLADALGETPSSVDSYDKGYQDAWDDIGRAVAKWVKRMVEQEIDRD